MTCATPKPAPTAPYMSANRRISLRTFLLSKSKTHDKAFRLSIAFVHAPKKKHELPLEMVRRQPQLVPTILRTVFDLEFPDQADATISSESFADFEPAELRCDATVLLDDPSKPSHGVVVEVQTRFEKGKLYSWPAYLATLRRRYKCGTTLLVICPEPARKLLEEMVKPPLRVAVRLGQVPPRRGPCRGRGAGRSEG